MQANVDFKQIVEGAGDAIMVCNAEGAITLWNRAAERIFGFTEAEALGQSLDMIIPQRQRQRHWDGYNKTMETGITKYGAENRGINAWMRASFRKSTGVGAI